MKNDAEKRLELIHQLLRDGVENRNEIFKEIKRQGLGGGRTQIYDSIKKAREQISILAYQTREPEPAAVVPKLEVWPKEMRLKRLRDIGEGKAMRYGNTVMIPKFSESIQAIKEYSILAGDTDQEGVINQRVQLLQINPFSNDK